MTTAWADDRIASWHRVLLLVEEWRHASGLDLPAARTEAQAALRYWRQYHQRPDAARYAAAVAASKQRRAVKPQSLAREGYERAWHQKQDLNR